jgi:excisionase family DNA binding protein
MESLNFMQGVYVMEKELLELCRQSQEQTAILKQIAKNLPNRDFSQEESLLTTVEVANLLNCSERTVRRYIEKGYLHSFQLMGKCYRVPRRSIDLFLKRENEIHRMSE